MSTNVTPIKTSRSREEWAVVITTDWRKSTESIIDVGSDLAAAKFELQHGDFEAMIVDDLPFSPRVARRLMAIANNPAIAKSANVADLPAMSALSELALLKEEDFKWAQKRKLITSNTTNNAARAIKGAMKAKQGEIVGHGKKTDTLPSPKEAANIARETDTMVMASDGNYYTGTTKAEAKAAEDRRSMIYDIIQNIDEIAAMKCSPGEWIDAGDFMLNRFNKNGELAKAVSWLNRLNEVWESRHGK